MKKFIGSENLTGFSNKVFLDCPNLTSIDLTKCTKLTQLSSSIQSFYNTGITKVVSGGAHQEGQLTLPENAPINTIGQAAFANCANLESVEIKTSATSGFQFANGGGAPANTGVFSGCPKLASVDISEFAITTIPANTFSGAPISTVQVGTTTQTARATQANTILLPNTITTFATNSLAGLVNPATVGENPTAGATNTGFLTLDFSGAHNNITLQNNITGGGQFINNVINPTA